MPRHPHISPAIAAMQGGVFSRLVHRIAGIEGERYPFHVGDTWLEPPEGCRLEDFTVAEHPGMHRYASPHGHPDLLSAIEHKRGVDRSRVLVTAGATGALGSVASALLEPGDEVIILAPYWPLISGIVRENRGSVVEAPFYDRPGTPAQRLAPHLSDKTVAIYLNSPNNPSGAVLSDTELAEIAAFAREHDLWIWADEIYETQCYRRPYAAIAPHAPERTISAYSFSKAYGMAGNRVGYLILPEGLFGAVRKCTLHGFYSVTTGAQLAAARVMRTGDAWLAEAAALYQAAGDAAAATLGVDPPLSGTFLFLDVREHLDERGLHGFLCDCIDEGLVLAPGTSCGSMYDTHVRACFTSAPPDVTARGMEKLAALLERTKGRA
jgi:aspartate/methionine/tyrosine aminotransferase